MQFIADPFNIAPHAQPKILFSKVQFIALARFKIFELAEWEISLSLKIEFIIVHSPLITDLASTLSMLYKIWELTNVILLKITLSALTLKNLTKLDPSNVNPLPLMVIGRVMLIPCINK